DFYSAKYFLERNWGYIYNYKEEEEEYKVGNISWNRQPGISLRDIAEYWQSLIVPDLISNILPYSKVEESNSIQLD
ncbi:hypothetical protein EDB80DRAFT_596255, partial [Ilyonectria destructans]